MYVTNVCSYISTITLSTLPQPLKPNQTTKPIPNINRILKT